MGSVAGVANSGMNAFSLAQAATASNVSRVNTSEAPTTQVKMQEKKSGGVDARISQSEDKVELSREATNMISNSNNYTANTKVMKASDDMTRTSLNIKA